VSEQSYDPSTPIGDQAQQGALQAQDPSQAPAPDPAPSDAGAAAPAPQAPEAAPEPAPAPAPAAQAADETHAPFLVTDGERFGFAVGSRRAEYDVPGPADAQGRATTVHVEETHLTVAWFDGVVGGVNAEDVEPVEFASVGDDAQG
jgi:hypothetical protein